MTQLDAHGLSVTLPSGWEGRVFRRPAAGELAATAADGPPAPLGEVTHAVVHVATIPLPMGVGDFASGAVEELGPSDALIVLFEYSPESATKALFAAEGLPRSLALADFSPSVLQRALRGQAGVQHFFHEADRAFCLYVVLGSYQNRAQVVPQVNQVLATFAIDGPVAPPMGNAAAGGVAPPLGTVIDVIRARPDLTTFTSLLDASGVVTLLAAEPNVTVFGPVDAVLDASAITVLRADAELLRRTMLQHVVHERLPVGVLTTRRSLTTAADGMLAVVVSGDSTISVGGVIVVPPPAEAANGLVYATGGLFEAPR